MRNALETSRPLLSAAIALLAVQVVHAAIPARTEASGYVGLIGGLVALVASIAAIVGVVKGRAWAPRLLGTTGASVAVGFLLYHALPIHSPFTNPYVHERAVGFVQWMPVVAAIGIGAWAAVVGWAPPRATVDAAAPY